MVTFEVHNWNSVGPKVAVAHSNLNESEIERLLMSAPALLAMVLALVRGILFPPTPFRFSEIQNWCGSFHFLPPPTPWLHPYRAIVCGIAPPAGIPLVENMKSLGLIHILVVSGSHLSILLSLLERGFQHLSSISPDSSRPALLRLQKLFIFLSLTGFAVMTGWQPPAVRSLLAVFVSQINLKWALGLKSDQQIQLSGLLTLLIAPHWVLSISLLMSWTAALALTIPCRNPRWLKTCLWIYALMLPFSFLGNLNHPASILANAFMAPLIGDGLFPLAALAWFLPFFRPLGDFCWSLLDFVLAVVTNEISHLPSPPPWNTLILWTYLILLHGILHFRRLHRSRHEA